MRTILLFAPLPFKEYRRGAPLTTSKQKNFFLLFFLPLKECLQGDPLTVTVIIIMITTLNENLTTQIHMHTHTLFSHKHTNVGFFPTIEGVSTRRPLDGDVVTGQL
jgi:hypothetical protein